VPTRSSADASKIRDLNVSCAAHMRIWNRRATTTASLLTITCALGLLRLGGASEVGASPAAALVSSNTPSASLSRAATPVLGYRRFARLVGVGWGAVKPKVVEEEGDGTAGFDHLRWTKWGHAIAYGRGRFDASLPKGGHRRVAGRLRVSNLGSCHGRLTYRTVEFRLLPKDHLGDSRRWHFYVSKHGDVCRSSKYAY
jgi:hypothetical protein